MTIDLNDDRPSMAEIQAVLSGIIEMLAQTVVERLSKQNVTSLDSVQPCSEPRGATKPDLVTNPEKTQMKRRDT